MSFLRHEENGILWYTSPLLSSHGVPHLFAGRRGGVSEGDFASLNVSTNRRDREGKTDRPERVSDNYRRALTLIGSTPERAAGMKQIHSAVILDADDVPSISDGLFSAEGMPSCDGLVLDGKNGRLNALSVKTADCVPILLCELSSGAVCALHAGWRGTVSGIAAEAVRHLREKSGHPQVLAAIGPCIGVCCYEVSEEVLNGALVGGAHYGIGESRVRQCFVPCPTDGKYMADLTALNRLFLLAGGMREENIDTAGLCTACTTDTEGAVFFSHRASGGYSGTQVSVIGAL